MPVAHDVSSATHGDVEGFHGELLGEAEHVAEDEAGRVTDELRERLRRDPLREEFMLGVNYRTRGYEKRRTVLFGGRVEEKRLVEEVYVQKQP